MKTISRKIRPFPIKDNYGLALYTINMNDILINDEPRVIIVISRWYDKEQIDLYFSKEKNNDDKSDEYVSYSSSSDYIMQAKPKYEK